MTQVVRDLLEQEARSIDPPTFDVNDLVAQMERRVARRRRLAALAVAAVAVGVVGAGAFALGVDREQPTPAPPGLGTPRSMVYADGQTIHVGDESIDAGADVVFVEATDDGVVFVTGDGYSVGEPQQTPLWFTDGSDPVQIGVTYIDHIYDFAVTTANPGSLVAWLAAEPGAKNNIKHHEEQIVVYDTKQRRMVASVPAYSSPASARSERIEHIAINGDRIYWEQEAGLGHEDAGVTRYDVSSQLREEVSWSSYHTDLAGNPRMLSFENASDQTASPPPVVAQRLAAFMQVGDRLVPTDNLHYADERTRIPTTRLGQPIDLRVPEGYDADITDQQGYGARPTNWPSFVVVQWLDDDHLVLFAYHEHTELPDHVGDILVCPVPSGTCELAVPASDTNPYVPPGDVY